MSESPDLHRTKALELAIQGGGTHAEVVTRANAYHAFLTGEATGKPAAAAAQTTAANPKPAAADKPAAATSGKPAAAPKATPAPGTKPAAAPKPNAASPKPAAAAAAPKAAAAAAPGAAPKGDTKDPKGNNTYDDVVAALQKVMRSVPGDNQKHDKGRTLAYEILAAKGGGVKGARDLKPALYDAVVAGCEAAVNSAAKPAAAKPAAAAAPKVAAAPTVVEDDLGGPVDTSGASAETAGDDYPPEGGSGEDA